MRLATGAVVLGVRPNVMLARADVQAAVESAGLGLQSFAPPDEAVAPTDAAKAFAQDPICHMRVAITEDTLQHTHAGTAYYFCAEYCRGRFMADPDSHVK